LLTTAWSGREPAVQITFNSCVKGGWLPPVTLVVGGFDILHLPMLTLAVFCAHAVLMIAAVLVVGRRRIQRVSAALFLAGSFILEWFAPVDTASRAILAAVGMFALMATITVATAATPQWSVGYRLLHLLTLGYPLRAGRIRPVLSRRMIGRFIVEGLVGGAAFLFLRHIALAQQPPEAVMALGRLVAGVILVYAWAAFLTDLIRVCFLASGAAMGPIHVTPIAARSLRDFWGKRWNRPVSTWLHRFVFLPLARQHRPDLGLCCAFLVSGAIHAWVAWVALGAFAAFGMVVFFGLQAVFILAEDRLQVHAWPVPLARAWTLTILLATSPLIICSYLRFFHL
jgi:hypothetical protein